MRHRNALGIPVELEHDEIGVLFDLDVGSVLALQVLRLAESFHTVWQCHSNVAAVDGQHCAFVRGSDFEDLLKRIPRVLLDLLVSEAHAAVGLVQLEHDHFDLISNTTEL